MENYSSLVKVVFQSLTLTLVYDSVSSLSLEHFRLLSNLGQFAHQTDTNIALTAAAERLRCHSIEAERSEVAYEVDEGGCCPLDFFETLLFKFIV